MTAQNGKGSKRRITTIDDDDWDLAFKRNGKNLEKNRYKRGNNEKKKRNY